MVLRVVLLFLFEVKTVILGCITDSNEWYLPMEIRNCRFDSTVWLLGNLCFAKGSG